MFRFKGLGGVIEVVALVDLVGCNLVEFCSDSDMG